MIEAGGGLCFAAETGEGFTRIGVVTQDAFHGDDAPRVALARAIDHAHAAAPDLFENFVIAETPVLVRQIHFGENAGERFRFAFIGRVESGFKQATDAKPALNVRGGIAMGTGPRIGEHARDGIGKSWGKRFHHRVAESAASTPHRWRISSSTSAGSATVSATSSRSRLR